MRSVRLHKTSQRVAMAQDLRRHLLGRDWEYCSETETRPEMHQFETKTRPRLWGFCPRRDWDEMLVCFETVSRPRHLDRDHIPVLESDTCFSLVDFLISTVNWHHNNNNRCSRSSEWCMGFRKITLLRFRMICTYFLHLYKI